MEIEQVEEFHTQADHAADAQAVVAHTQREMLGDMTLREVDERFARWLEAERADGGPPG